MALGAQSPAPASGCVRRATSLVAAWVLAAATIAGQSPPTRDYVEGETDRYELLVRVGDAPGELSAVSEHRVVVEGGVTLERVRWIRVSETVAGDLTDAARQSAPFELSLDRGARPNPAPAVGNPALQMLSDSLHLIYVAVNPSLGLSRLEGPGDVVTSEDPYVEDAFEGPGAQRERWSAALRFAFVSADAQEAVIRTEFSPPLETPWSPFRDWMETACGRSSGNFEVLARQGRGFVAAWGCERSRVTARISFETGKITHANLESRVRFHRRSCADEALTECDETVEGETRIRATLVHKQSDRALSPDVLTVNPKDGLEYVKVPAGSFQMGCVPDDGECYPRERPRHEVRISRPFWLGRTEVPVEAYERFVSETGSAMPSEPRGLEDFNDGWRKKSHPMVKVTWREAQAYCTWVGGRLPTEAEWEYAARGGRDGLKYPWGNERSHDEANFWRSGGLDVWKHTAPVGSFPANGFGLYDMAGNVYEWTADWFDEDYYGRSLAVDPPGPESGRFRAVRGGSGFINPAVLRVSTRLKNAPDARRLGVGFRCVLDSAP